MYGYHTLNILWAMLLYHPGVLIMMISGALCVSMLTMEFVTRRGRRGDLQQQSAYERQETVFYVSPRDRMLLRPAQIPPAAPDELLRSAEPAAQSVPSQLLRAGEATDNNAGAN